MPGVPGSVLAIDRAQKKDKANSKPLAQELKRDEDVQEAMLASERYALLHSVKVGCDGCGSCQAMMVRFAI